MREFSNHPFHIRISIYLLVVTLIAASGFAENALRAASDSPASVESPATDALGPGPVAPTSAKPNSAVPDGYMLYVTQPNGWGDSPEAAIMDLRKRILPWYQKTFGDRPGFYVDWHWYAVVEVADGREWQADGRVGWYVPVAKAPPARVHRTSQGRVGSK